MDCSACVYYDKENQCKLHGRLKSLDQMQLCDDFIDSNESYRGGICCGIYNYPPMSRLGSKKAPKSETGCTASGD